MKNNASTYTGVFINPCPVASWTNKVETRRKQEVKANIMVIFDEESWSDFEIASTEIVRSSRSDFPLREARESYSSSSSSSLFVLPIAQLARFALALIVFATSSRPRPRPRLMLSTA
jgi:hypothetical protein